MQQTKEMQQSVVISRYVFGAICALIVILAIALFITLTKEPDKKDPKSVVEAASAWIQDKEVAPLGSSELQGYFNGGRVFGAVIQGRWAVPMGRSRREGIEICGES